MERATTEEKNAIAVRIRAAMPEGDSWSDGYRRQTSGRFLLDLEQAKSDTEAFLEICRLSGLLAESADRLLRLGRLEEALAEVELAADYDLLGVANVFLRHGCSQQIEPLVAKRIEADQSGRMLDWLKERYKERGELVEALALAKQKLEQRPPPGLLPGGSGAISRIRSMAGIASAAPGTVVRRREIQSVDRDSLGRR